METLFDVNWVSVVVGGVVAFILGSLWYSPMMFGNGWRQGLGTPAIPNRPMAPLLIVEALATFMLAWLLVLSVEVSMAFTVLVVLVIAAAVKANSLFTGKSLYAIGVEAWYIVAKSAVIIALHQIFT